MLELELGISPKLIRGSGGIFEVAVGQTVVAKKTLNGFPTESEILKAVREATA